MSDGSYFLIQPFYPNCNSIISKNRIENENFCIYTHKLFNVTNMSYSKLSNRAIDWIKSNPHLSEKQHQISGIKWCLNRELDLVHGGGILADEMGLGKTILMIAAIVANPKLHTLIVVPPALVNQWKTAIELFAPEVNTMPTGKCLPIPIYKSSKYTEIPHERGSESLIYDFNDLFKG